VQEEKDAKPGASLPAAPASAATHDSADGGAGSDLVKLPTLSAPKGGGAIQSIGEKFSANPATGTASLGVPIAASPGRAGFVLGLTVSYDSGAGNGPFGAGWGLSLPTITRKTDKGLPRYVDGETPDVFILSGAEDLVPARRSGVLEERDDGEYVVRRYRPRVENAFSRIERWTHRATGEMHWRTTDAGNVTSLFGRSPLGRVTDPDDSRRVFSWLLEETRDDRGNVVVYEYKAEDGAGVDPTRPSESHRFEHLGNSRFALRVGAQRYLKRVLYGNGRPFEASGWHFEVVFDYGEHDERIPTPSEDRPWHARRDPFSNYRAGFEVRTYRLCRRALLFHRFEELGAAPLLVRSTDFTYEERDHLSLLVRAEQAGYLRDAGTGQYERASMPPLDVGYTRREVHHEVRVPEAESLEGIPGGVDGTLAQWTDLDGEGIPGALVANDRGWYYKANLGDGLLAPPKLLRELPVPAQLRGGMQTLVDLASEGRLDLVQFRGPVAGYFGRTGEGGWTPFAPFRETPRIDWDDPNLRFLDVDGDGLVDVLVTEDQALVWYRSRAKHGFDGPEVVRKPLDEARGPALLFADRSETIFTADMSGDGLVDIVRIRSGEVCYWPNLGYGKFGRKVTMDGCPRFDAPDQFDPRRIRLVDVDGSGTADVLYLGSDGVRVYFNESGNLLADPVRLDLPLPVGGTNVGAVDLLGHGTACLVWSSGLPGDQSRPIAYVDLMGGVKPHLLSRFANGLGAETRLRFASSTEFYLRDQREGRPWLTRLAFPVHVLERVERHDHVAESRLVTRYRYHHGFYDGVEREFRGFALVEQWDAEAFTGGAGKGLFPDAVERVSDDLRVPPVRTKTWFHTGAWLEHAPLERALAGEYYRGDLRAPRLAPTVVPRAEAADDEREAARALKGCILRQEVYAEDETARSAHPYTVSERAYVVRRLQPVRRGEHGVFFVHPREQIDLAYERNPDDPRAQHQMALAVDEFGFVTQAATIIYPRRTPKERVQDRTWAMLADATYFHHPAERGWYRLGIPVESRTSELTGLETRALFSVEDVRERADAAREIPYEQAPTAGLERRVYERRRTTYYRDDLTGPLPLGQVESRALPYERLRAALTTGLFERTYGGRVDPRVLIDEGAYVLHDGVWWSRSGRLVFEPRAFFQPVESVDPWDNRAFLRFDPYALLVLETRDALENVVSAEYDYRVLAAVVLTDANRNRTATAYDARGMPVRIAVMGKEGAGEGDTLEDPTARIDYRFQQPARVHTVARENHGPQNRRWQETYSYVDGSGREVMRKFQAPPGEAPTRRSDGSLERDADGTLRLVHVQDRWIGTGRTIFDNKGNPIKKYEAFFSSTFEYEHERELREWGVTAIQHYDPLGRLFRTELPDGSSTREVIDSWTRATWDENDSVLGSPWYLERGAPDPRGPQPHDDPRRRAAWLAAQCADTPKRAHLDGPGRVVVAEDDNRDPQGLYRTEFEIDVVGNTLSVVDARGVRALDRQTFDMLGRPLFTTSADSGWSLALTDAAGQPLRGWDVRGFELRYAYDELRRRTHVWAAHGDRPERVVERRIYGEGHPEALARNLRARMYQVYDGAGLATSGRFDFKGNAVEARRSLAPLYREEVDWSVLPAGPSVAAIEEAARASLSGEVFLTTTRYDALNRIVAQTTPDGTETRPFYDPSNLLARVDVVPAGAAHATTFVESIEYNARGQRTLVVRGNGSRTRYGYDPARFRLSRVVTRRTEGADLQELEYVYDALGNVVEVRDGVSFGNPSVSAGGLYEYDPIYRLIHAEGREHPGQQPSFEDAPLVAIAHAHDLESLRRYREVYEYDRGGNILAVEHRSMHGPGPTWTRQYEYGAGNNRLLRTHGRHADRESNQEHYDYDAHGNMTSMPHLRAMRWDYASRLASIDRGGGGQAYFAYDAGGQRVRKVYEHGGLVEERIYLGNYEVYRKRPLAGGAPELERVTHHVMDGTHRLAMIETKRVDAEAPRSVPEIRTRYVLDNLIDSSAFELDESAKVISYEEYYPFGGTAVRAWRSGTELSAKRYRYIGQERDTETGLYYCGARYYAAWLGRWTSCDPSGPVEGFNPYHYAGNHPISASDPSGRWSVGTWVAIAVVAVVVVAAIVVTAGAAAAVVGPLAAAAAETGAVAATAAVATETAAVATTAVVATETAAVATTAVAATEAAVATTAVAATETAAVATTAVATTEATAVATTAVATTETAAAVTTAAAGTEGAVAATTATVATTEGAAATTAVATTGGAATTSTTAASLTATATKVAAVGVAAAPALPTVVNELETVGPQVVSEVEAVAPAVENLAEEAAPALENAAAGGKDILLRGSSGATARLTDITARLQGHVQSAVQTLQTTGLTVRQRFAVLLRPNLRRAFEGERIDTFFKESADKDTYLMDFVDLTRRFVRGPDVIAKFPDATVFPASPMGTGLWWDVTTPASWAAHVTRYAAWGFGIPLFY
jgi:RHS repeat-associated protein